MNAPSYAEFESLGRTVAGPAAQDNVFHWHSAFGLVIIEVRNGEVYVDGDLVQPAKDQEKGST